MMPGMAAVWVTSSASPLFDDLIAHAGVRIVLSYPSVLNGPFLSPCSFMSHNHPIWASAKSLDC